MANFVLWSVIFSMVVGLAAGAYPKIERSPSIINVFIENLNNAKKHLVSAAVARSISIVGMYPLDTIKTRIQIGRQNPFSVSGLYGKTKQIFIVIPQLYLFLLRNCHEQVG